MLDEMAPTFPSSLGFAHDLGNLLQTATSAISIIDKCTKGRSPRVDLAIAGAKASIQRAGELARRTLEEARGGPAFAVETDVSECITEVAMIFGSATEPAIQLDVEVDPTIPPVNCGHVALQNAVLNLVFNARDAIAESGRITIRALAKSNGSEIEISVADDGVGMSVQTIERAFEPFFTTKCEGLGGIGLPMVERFVRASNGKIWIESGLGTGTVVKIQLPASSRDKQPREDI